MADPDLQIKGGGGGGLGGGHPDPEIRGRTRSPKNFFRSFGPHFGRQIRGGAGPSPGSATSFIFLPCLLSCALFPKLLS